MSGAPSTVITDSELPSMSGISADIVAILHSEVVALKESAESLLFNTPLAHEALKETFNELWGVCQLLEMPAAASLVRELDNTVTFLVEQGLSPLQHPELSITLNIIPKLVRNMIRVNRRIPFLFMPELADLRRLQGLPPLYEFQLLTDYEWPASDQFHGETELTEEARATLKKLKQLYQVGLLDILRGTNTMKGVEVLARVAARMQLLFTSSAEVKYWSLVESVTSAMARGSLAFNPVRIRLLAALERQLKTLLDGPSGKSPYPLGLWRAFAILLAMVPDRDNTALEISEWCGAPRFDFTDSDIAEARTVVFDGDNESLASIVQDVEGHLGVIHALLEHLDSQGSLVADENTVFADQLRELAELCRSHSLGRAASRLQGHHLDIVEAGVNWPERTELLRDIVHTVLYLECLLQHIREQNFALHGLLGQLDRRSVDDVVDEKLVASSISAVWSECLRKLSVAKDLIDDIATERGGDDIAVTLETEFDEIRGAALLAGEERVAGIARRCRDFVATALGAGSVVSASLATFADAVVALEYYFQNSRTGEHTDFVLVIAAEHLSELEAALP